MTFASVRFGSLRFGSRRVGSDRVGSGRVGSVGFGSVLGLVSDYGCGDDEDDGFAYDHDYYYVCH